MPSIPTCPRVFITTMSEFLPLNSLVGRARAMLPEGGIMITLSFLAGIGLCGLVFMLVELRDAPEGYQDQGGFHFVWRNNRPEVPDISCIWGGRSGNNGDGLRRAA
jgi:hypothetical protein